MLRLVLKKLNLKIIYENITARQWNNVEVTNTGKR